MAAGNDNPDKKDLTGMFSLPGAAPSSNEPTTQATPTETVDSFESMTPDMSLPEPNYDVPPTETAASGNDDFDPFQEPAPAPTTRTQVYEPTEVSDSSSVSSSAISSSTDPLDELRQYSQSIQGTSQLVQVFVPYHLYMTGTFGPFERDKLLLFITENEVGVSSQDLDLQIRAGRVFFPRISEFAGIKLIQDLRDSGLHFRFVPSDRDQDEVMQQTPGVEFHYQPTATDAKPLQPIPVLPENSKHLGEYSEIDTAILNQYLKAEVVEAERSDLFQEVLERMLESLKQKARIKGGDALGNYQQKVTPLRLPSQYQVTVQATILKKR